MPSKVRDEITYPFPNFNGPTDEVWGWISNFTPPFKMDVIRMHTKITIKQWYIKYNDPSSNLQSY